MMEPIQWNDYRWRCSALGAIMTNFDSKELTAGHITACKEAVRTFIDKRTPVFGNKYTRKGLLLEEHAITLLSRYLKKMLKKNDKRLSNFFITGHPDIYIGPDIEHAEIGYDTKCAWSYKTFPYPDAKNESGYEYQNHGYMYLTGAKEWHTCYTLVNSMPDDIEQAKKNLWYNLGQPADEDEEYVYKCREIEKDMIFNLAEFKKEYPYFDMHIRAEDWQYDIPLERRVIQFTTMRDENVIAKIAERVQKCRMKMKEFHTKYYLINAA